VKGSLGFDDIFDVSIQVSLPVRVSICMCCCLGRKVLVYYMHLIVLWSFTGRRFIFTVLKWWSKFFILVTKFSWTFSHMTKGVSLKFYRDSSV
jgi:hypothetical protein